MESFYKVKPFCIMKNFLVLCLLLVAGCQTAPRGMVVTSEMESEHHPRVTTKTHFDAGEVPTLCLFGYEGKHVNIEVVDLNSGKTVVKEEADVPKRGFKGQNVEVTWVNEYGRMVPKKKISNIVTSTDMLLPLSLPETSNYEARVMVDGKIAQTVQFRVEWKSL